MRTHKSWLALACFSVMVGCSPEIPGTTSGVILEPKPVAVRVAEVHQKEIASLFHLVGTVTAIRRSVVGCAVEGRVMKVSIDTGDAVAFDSESVIGDPMVELSTEMISAEVAAAKAELVRLEHELAEFNAGTRPEELAQAKARWLAANTANEFAQSNLKRIQELFNSKAISEDQLDAAQSAALAAEQTAIAAKAGHDLAIAGPRKEQIDQSIAKVKRQTQELARLETMLRYHTIRAPFEGFVVKKTVEVGQWLTRGDPVAEIVELGFVDVVVHVPESLVSQLKVGSSVPVTINALPEDSRRFEGTIHGIVPSADQRSRTFPVRIRVKNPVRDGSYLLKDGMHARAAVTGNPKRAVLVSKDALNLGGPKTVVMLAVPGPDGKPVASRVEVDTGVSDGDFIEVVGELAVGQQVIVMGNERVKPGQTLDVVSGGDPK